MMRTLVACLFLGLAASCSTLGGGSGGRGERLEMTGLEDMSLEYIKTKWGEPDSIVPKGDGKLVRFKNIRSEEEQPVTRKVTVKSCEVRLDLGKDQLVKSWEYENCRIVSTSK